MASFRQPRKVRSVRKNPTQLIPIKPLPSRIPLAMQSEVNRLENQIKHIEEMGMDAGSYKTALLHVRANIEFQKSKIRKLAKSSDVLRAKNEIAQALRRILAERAKNEGK